ncbi:hypothetical protein BJX66DRAFT_317353 [Aspergillus keveii]|uniref:Uncharacterized protein n=1 Tax=Aspergillus keveii TaxID=714993 RepID=A0ABR4FLD6_9EURO
MPAQIHTTFTTASGALCFGTLQNIWSGASKPLSKEIPQDERKTTFSLPAKKGTWNVFRLLDAEGHIPCVWFACHISVDAEVEVDRIIRAAGSTRDEDKVKGKEGGILVFDPFDWGGYGLSAGEARRAAREINEVVTDPVDKSAAVGLSDWAQAKSAIKAWSRKIPADRESTASAVWMYIPSAHNRFGRFGLDDARTAVQSFLFCTWDANKFTRTFFPGCETTLRRHENEKRAELHDRYIREGVDHFLGIDWLNQQDKVKPARNEPVTKKRKTSRKSDSTLVLLGPYDQSEHILSQEDIRVLRVQSGYQGPPPDWYELRRQQERGIMIGGVHSH